MMTMRMTQVARNNSNTENGAATSCRGDEAGAGGSSRGRGTAAGVDDGMLFSNNECWNSDSSVCGEWGVGEIDDNGRAARCDC
jgi:hypothetical protein